MAVLKKTTKADVKKAAKEVVADVACAVCQGTGLKSFEELCSVCSGSGTE